MTADAGCMREDGACRWAPASSSDRDYGKGEVCGGCGGRRETERLASKDLPGTFPGAQEKEKEMATERITENEGQTSRERNLDRAVNLAATGRIKPQDVVETAQEFDEFLRGDES